MQKIISFFILFPIVLILTTPVRAENFKRIVSEKSDIGRYISYKSDKKNSLTLYLIDNEKTFQYKKNNLTFKYSKNKSNVIYTVILDENDIRYFLSWKTIENKNIVTLLKEKNPIYFYKNEIGKICLSPNEKELAQAANFSSFALPQESPFNFSQKCTDAFSKIFKNDFKSEADKVFLDKSWQLTFPKKNALSKVNNKEHLLHASEALSSISSGDIAVAPIKCEVSDNCNVLGSYKPFDDNTKLQKSGQITLYPDCLSGSVEEKKCQLQTALFEELLHQSMTIGNDASDHKDIKEIAKLAACVQLSNDVSLAFDTPNDHKEFSQGVVTNLQPEQFSKPPNEPQNLGEQFARSPATATLRTVAGPAVDREYYGVEAGILPTVRWATDAMNTAIRIASNPTETNAAIKTSKAYPNKTITSPAREPASEKNSNLSSQQNESKSSDTKQTLTTATVAVDSQKPDSKILANSELGRNLKQNAITSTASNNQRSAPTLPSPVQQEASTNLVSPKPINASNINTALPKEITTVIPGIRTISEFTSRLKVGADREKISKILAEKKISIIDQGSTTIGVANTALATHVFAITGSGSQTRLRRIDRNNR